MNVVWKLSGRSTGWLREVDFVQPGHKKWSLWWIAANEDGSGKSEALTFTGVEALKHTEFLAYSPELINDTYDNLVDLGKTSFLAEVTANLQVRMNVTDLRHFAISFDSSPLFELIANYFEFEARFDASILGSYLKQRLVDCVPPVRE